MNDKQNLVADETLVKLSMEGDQDAFRTLVKRYEKSLLNYIYRFINNREIAEEVTQDTFIAVLENIQKFKLEASFRAWVYAIATNRALNILRRPLHNKDSEEIIQNTPTAHFDPYEKISQQERAIAVQKALSELPEKHRAIFILRFYQELSYEEIAVALGLPLGTVKSRMCFALKKLKGILWSHRELGE